MNQPLILSRFVTLFKRLSAVDRRRYQDEISYQRAIALRRLMLAVLPVDLLFIPASLLNRDEIREQRLLDTANSAGFSLLVILLYWLAGRGTRSMINTGWTLIPLVLILLTVSAAYTGGLQAPPVNGIWSVVILAGLFIGTSGVVVASLVASALMICMVVATKLGWFPLRPLVSGKNWLVAPILISAMLFMAYLMIIMERISQRLLESAVAHERAHQQAQARTEALAELDRSRTVFFSNISHELRTPLALSLGVIGEMLERRELPAEVHGSLEMVRRNDRRLLKLVNTLLEFARIEAGRIEALYEPLDLSLTTAELAGEFRSAIEQAGLGLKLELEPLGTPVYVDRGMWEQIIFNLLSNALKFTMEGEIAVRLAPAPDCRVQLTVRDTGCGIAQEDLPLLFRRFHRLQAPKARTHEGSGIGLALVHELVRLHGGDIQVHSALGTGTTFTVTLPLGKEHLPVQRIGARTPQLAEVSAAPFVEEALRWLPGSREPGAGPVLADHGSAVQGLGTEAVPAVMRDPAHSGQSPMLPTLRVLLVEDHPDMRAYLARLLSRRFEVQAVASGDAALELLRQGISMYHGAPREIDRGASRWVPDLVLTDVMMAGITGLQLVRAVRHDLGLRQLPVILLSARAGPDNAIEGLQAGADDYIEKPFAARELLERVTARLQLASARREALDVQDRFVKVVVHELRNPMSILKGHTQVMQVRTRRGELLLPPDTMPAMDRAIGRIERLLEDLADVARIQSGKMTLELERCDLRELCHEVVDEQEMASKRQIELEVPGPEGLAEAVVRGDHNRLSQVLTNLLANALTYSPAEAPVKVTLRVADRQAVVAVRDWGPGIPPERQTLIFAPFYRMGSEQKQRYGTAGLGLGLFICKELIEQHEGRIWVESVPPAGSTFCFSLPLM